MQRFTLILLITQILCAIMHSMQAQDLDQNFIMDLEDAGDIWNEADFELLKAQNYLFTINHTYEAVPKNFDSRVKWPNCPSIKRIINQGQCGSCWAHAATAVISDRTCIASKGTVKRIFSAEDLITCCPETVCWNPSSESYKKWGRCGGGKTYMAVKFWIDNGLVSGGHFNTSEGCKPLSLGSYNKHLAKVTKCEKKCSNKKYKVTYKRDQMFGKNLGMLKREHYYNVTTVQIEIMKNGPVAARMVAGSKFSSHRWNKAAILMDCGNLTSRGGHAVRIIGWGVEGKIPYWIVANSWGDKWGHDGFFKILRGQHVCEIETWALAPVSDISRTFVGAISSATISHTLLTSTFLIIFCFIILRTFS